LTTSFAGKPTKNHILPTVNILETSIKCVMWSVPNLAVGILCPKILFCQMTKDDRRYISDSGVSMQRFNAVKANT